MFVPLAPKKSLVLLVESQVRCLHIADYLASQFFLRFLFGLFIVKIAFDFLHSLSMTHGLCIYIYIHMYILIIYPSIHYFVLVFHELAILGHLDLGLLISNIINIHKHIPHFRKLSEMDWSFLGGFGTHHNV